MTWEEVQGATGYLVERKGSGGEWTSIGAAVSATFIDSNAAPGTEYEYRIASASAQGHSQYSLPVGVTTPIGAPNSLMAQRDYQSGDVELNWSYGTPDPQGFRIERFDPDISEWVEIADVSGTSQSYTDTSPSAIYNFYRVFAYGPEIESPQYNIAVAELYIAGMDLLHPSSAAIIQGGPPAAWFNEVDQQPTLEEALTSPGVAGVRHPLGIFRRVEYTFDFGVQNNPGPDIVAFAFYSGGNLIRNEILTGAVGAGQNLGWTRFYGNWNGASQGQFPVPVHAFLFDLGNLNVPLGEAITTLVHYSPSDFMGIGALSGLGIGIDLSVSGLADADDEAVGGLLAVNNNRDENNYDASGFPILDNEPDTEDGHRVNNSDRDLVLAKLNILSPYFGPGGQWTLTFSDKIKIWRGDNHAEVTSGTPMSYSGAANGPTTIDLLIEGMEYSDEPRDISILSEFTVGGSTYSDVVKLTAPKLEYVAWDPETGETFDAEDTAYASELRPEVELNLSDAHLDQSGNLVVTASINIFDALSEVVAAAANRVQRLFIYANNQLVDGITNLSAYAGPPASQPWQAATFNLSFTRTLVIPPRSNEDGPLPWGGEGVVIRVETSPNAAGNVGWDQSSVALGWRHEDEFSEGLGNPHGVGVMLLGDGVENPLEAYYPVIETIKDLPGSQPGSFYPTLARITALDDALAARLDLVQNGEKRQLKPFTFSPTKHYVVKDAGDNRPQIFVLTSDTLEPSVLQSVTPDNFKVWRSGSELKFSVRAAGGRVLSDVDVSVLTPDTAFRLPDDVGGLNIPTGPVTMESLLVYFQLLYGDRGLTVLQYYRNAGCEIELTNLLPGRELDLDYFGVDGLLIQIDKYVSLVQAAQLLATGLDRSLGFNRVKQQIPQDDFESIKASYRAALKEAAGAVVAGTQVYLAGISIVSEPVDWILTVHDLSEGNYAAALGFLPFISARMLPNAKVLMKRLGDANVHGNFDKAAVDAIVLAMQKADFDEQFAILESALTVAQRDDLFKAKMLFQAPKDRNGLARRMMTVGHDSAGFSKTATEAHYGGYVVAHHDFQFAKAEWFIVHGIDVNKPEYGRWVRATEPGTAPGPKRLHSKWHHEFNKDWKTFIDDEINRPGGYTKQEVINFMNTLRARYPAGGSP